MVCCRSEELDFASNKPHNYSAGLPVALAGAAVSVAMGMFASNNRHSLGSTSSNKNESFNSREVAAPTVLDPCCGSGTIVYEAWRRGSCSRGVDAELRMVEMAAANLMHFANNFPHQPQPTIEVRLGIYVECERLDERARIGRIPCLLEVPKWKIDNSNFPFGYRYACWESC